MYNTYPWKGSFLFFDESCWLVGRSATSLVVKAIRFTTELTLGCASLVQLEMVLTFHIYCLVLTIILNVEACPHDFSISPSLWLVIISDSLYSIAKTISPYAHGAILILCLRLR